jgi:hypothetical protein
MTASRLTKRLVKRLVAEGMLSDDEADGAKIARTYVGYWQVKEGAWLWVLEDRGGRILYGSIWPASQVVRWSKIIRNGDALWPDDDDVK